MLSNSKTQLNFLLRSVENMLSDSKNHSKFKSKIEKNKSGTSSKSKIFKVARVHSVVYLSLNFISVLFLNVVVGSQRIILLNKKQKISILQLYECTKLRVTLLLAIL